MVPKNREPETAVAREFGGSRDTRPKVVVEDHRSGAGKRTREELETVVRFDRAGPMARLWTADLGQARRWLARGYPVEPVSGGWSCEVPKRALTFRRVTAAMLAAGAGPEDGDELPEDLAAMEAAAAADHASPGAIEDDDEALARLLAEEEAGS